MTTQKLGPPQTELDWTQGAPEGREYGPAGYVLIDAYTGLWWRKTTPQEFNTGWVLFGGGGIGLCKSYNLEFVSPSDLPDQPDDPSQAWRADFFDGSPSMRWSVIMQAWV